MRNSVASDYVKRLSDEALDDLAMRFQQDLAGDKAMICEFLSQDKEVDKWLAKAADADEFFDMLEVVGEAVLRECNYRDEQARRKR